MINNPNTYGTPSSDYFGQYLALSDTYYAIAATSEDQTSYSTTGVVYVFDLASGNLLHTLRSSQTKTSSLYFGSSIQLTDQYCAIGHSHDTYRFVEIFNPQTGSFIKRLNLPSSRFTTYFPAEVDDETLLIALFGNHLVTVSKVNTQDFSSMPEGLIYIFDIPSGKVVREIPGTILYRKDMPDFGTSIAFSGEYLVVGAGNEGSWLADEYDRGLIHTYRFENSDYTDWIHYGRANVLRLKVGENYKKLIL